MVKNTYEYDNKKFYSLKELASYAGINEKTLTARLRRGIPIEEACKKTDLRCSYCMYNGAEKSVTQICNDEAKNRDLVRNRLKYGYTLQEALNKPKKIRKQGKPIVVNGILYNSVAEAIRRLGLSHKEGVIRGKLYRGKSPDEAFSDL